MLIYLSLSSIAAFVGALLLLRFGDPSLPAAAHLVFAVGIVPLIFGAITHFVPVLTRSGGVHRGVSLASVFLQLAGLATVLDFTGQAPAGTAYLAAASALPVATCFAGWLVLRAGRTLGKPHPGWRWYLAAIIFFCIALILVPAMHWWPDARRELRLLHLHLNTLGFVGLTALGTLQVLLPTVLSGPDADAARRLRSDLPVAAGAVLAVAVGAVWTPLALAGAIALFFVAFSIALAWMRRYGWRTLVGDGTAAPLSGALFGFLLLLVLGVTHAFAGMDGRNVVPAFVAAFLLPLVTGALTHLLPVWVWPGKRTARRARMRAQLRSGGALRAILFVLGGVALALAINEGIWLVAVGMLSFVVVLLLSLMASRRGQNY